MKRTVVLGLLAACGFTAHGQMQSLGFDLNGPVLRPNALGGGTVAGPEATAFVNQQPGAPIPAPPPGKMLPGARSDPAPKQPPARRPFRSTIVPNTPPKYDRFGDPLPPGALARYGSVRLRHGPDLMGLGFSPDGKMLGSIAATDDGIRLWDPATGKELHRYPNPATLAAFARDGSLLVVDDARCKVWVPAGNVIRELPEKTFAEAPVALTVHPDCKTFFASTAAKVVQLDYRTGKGVRELSFPGTEPPVRLAVSPDGRWLAGSAQKTGVWLWDLRTGKRVRTYRADIDYPEYCFSPDGTRIAIAASQLSVCHVDSEELVEGFKPPDGVFQNPRFSKDGKAVFAITNEGSCVRIDAQTGVAHDLGNVPDVQLCAPMAIAPEGTFAAAVDAGGGIRIWDPATGKEPEADRLPPLSVPSFSADGKTVSCLDADNRIHTFEAAGGKRSAIVELTVDDEATVAWNPRAGVVVAIVADENDNEIQVIDTTTKRIQCKLKLPLDGPVGTVQFAALDKSRAAVFSQSAVCIFNLGTGKLIRTLAIPIQHEDPPLHGALSPDGRLVAVNSRPLTLWEVATGKKRFDFHAVSHAQDARFSPDGRWLAAWDAQGSIVVFDVRLGTVVRRVQANLGDRESLAVAFSPDGKRFAAGDPDGGITVWEVATGVVLASLDRHEGAVTGLEFSPDGTRLASTSQDGTVLIWEATATASGKPAEAAVAGLEEAFRLLGSADAAQAQRGLEYLYRRPAEAVKHIGARIAAPVATPPATIARLVADLDSEDYPVRQAAVKQLQTIGGEAMDALRKVVEKSINPEARKLAGEVMAAYEGAPPRAEDLRLVRIVELLESANTPEARALLTKWAAGPAGHRMTAEASAALARLKSRE